MESKTVLDSGFHAVDSGFWVLDSGYWITVFVSETWILDSNHQWDSGFLVLHSGIQSPGLRILKLRISRIPDSGFHYMG